MSRKGNEKGRVENGVGYVKKNLLNGLDIPSFAAIQSDGRRWRDETSPMSAFMARPIASPLDLFAQENPLLQAFCRSCPTTAPSIRPVDANGCCHVIFDTNRYSVPHLYASQKLTLKLYPGQLYSFTTKNSSPPTCAVTIAVRTSPIPITPRT